MSRKVSLHLSQWQKRYLIVLFSLFILVIVLEWTVQRRVQRTLDDLIVTGSAQVDFTLLINQVSIAVEDSTIIQLDDSTSVRLDKGGVDVCGFGIWNYMWTGDPIFRVIEVSSTLMEIDHSSPAVDTSQSSDLLLHALRLSLDTFNFYLDQRVFRGADFRIELDELIHKDSFWGFELVKLNGRDLFYEDIGVLKCEIGEAFLPSLDEPLLIRRFSFREVEGSGRNRAIIKADLDSLRAHQMRGMARESEWSTGHLELSGLHFDIDQMGERPLCDGRKPCVQKLMTEVLLNVPVRDSIIADGHLTFRHFEKGSIASELILDSYQCAIRYDTSWHFRDPGSASCEVLIKASVNGGIPLDFEGEFYGSQEYGYSLCTGTFQMPLLNPSIPKQDGFEVKIESGMCERFCMDVQGEGRESVASYNVEYKALKLDVLGKKKLKSQLIKTALPLAVNREFETDEPLRHESRLSEERIFLYELGDHVNEGFKMSVLKSWLR